MRRLAIGIVLAASAEFVIATTGVQIHHMPPRTDFATYYVAGQMAHDGVSPYDEPALAARWRDQGHAYDQYPYLYLPSFALAMQPLSRLPFERARQWWMVGTTLAVLLALAATLVLVRLQVRALGIEQPGFAWALAAALAPAALNSASVHSDIRLGSVGAWFWLACAAAAWGLLRSRSLLLGLALALATYVKLTPAILILYAWWRGERRGAAIAGAILALSMVPAFVHWGPAIVRDYWVDGLVPTLHAQIGWAIDQSLDAFLLRVFDPSALGAIPQAAPLAKTVLSIALSLVIVGVTLRQVARRRRERTLLPLELGYLVLALLIVMKVTWVHTLAALLFVWPVLMAVVVRAAERGAPWAVRAGILASVGFFLSSAHFPVLWNERFFHGPWIVVTGVHLFGTILLWLVAGFALQRSAAVWR